MTDRIETCPTCKGAGVIAYKSVPVLGPRLSAFTKPDVQQHLANARRVAALPVGHCRAVDCLILHEALMALSNAFWTRRAAERASWFTEGFIHWLLPEPEIATPADEARRLLASAREITAAESPQIDWSSFDPLFADDFAEAA